MSVAGMAQERHDFNKEVAMATKTTEVQAAPDITKRSVVISPPKFERAEFDIFGDLIVIHRFSAKTKNEMKLKMETGKAASSKKGPRSQKHRCHVQRSAICECGRLGWLPRGRAAQGDDIGMPASWLQNDLRFSFSIFVEADGRDKDELADPAHQDSRDAGQTGRHGAR